MTTRRCAGALPAIAMVALSCGGAKPDVRAQRLRLGRTLASTGDIPLPGSPQQPPQGFAEAIQQAWADGMSVHAGKNADHIPELARADAHLFGIVVVRTDGEMFEAGDTAVPFTMQSIAKIFTLARALADHGAPTIEKRIGVDATGQPVDSLVTLGLNQLHKRPPTGNPLVDAGAIGTVALVTGRDAGERWNRIVGTMNAFAGRSLTIDEKVYKSQSESNARHQGLSWLLKADAALGGDPVEVLDLYTRQCAVVVTARDLAAMGATLANGGVNPRTGHSVISAELAAQILALMSTAGLDASTGTWMFNVGVPAQSGAGGGILAVVPGRYAIAAFAPPLDEAGNSVRAQKAIQSLVTTLGGNIFGSAPRAAAAAARPTARALR